MPLTLRRRIFLTLVPLVLLLAVLGSAGVVLLWRLGNNINNILRENYRSLAETLLQLHEDRPAAGAARSLAAVAAGLPRETYFAACFMARSAAAGGGEERQQRIALALQYLQQAVEAGFNDLPLFEKDCKDKFAILEKEKAFLVVSQKLRGRAEQKRLPDSPKR